MLWIFELLKTEEQRRSEVAPLRLDDLLYVDEGEGGVEESSQIL